MSANQSQDCEDAAGKAVAEYRACLLEQRCIEGEYRKLRLCSGLDPERSRKALEDACDPCFQNRDVNGAVIQDEFPPE